MATREQIEALKIDENVFELAEDTELEYLVHFAAPFTGGDKCLVPKGTASVMLELRPYKRSICSRDTHFCCKDTNFLGKIAE